jgi:signal transduction histidine kinase
MFKSIADKIEALTLSERTTIWQVEEDPFILRPLYMQGVKTSMWDEFTITIDVEHPKGIAEMAALFNEIYLLNNITQEANINRHFQKRTNYPVHRTLCVPIMHNGVAVAVVQCLNKHENYTANDITHILSLEETIVAKLPTLCTHTARPLFNEASYEETLNAAQAISLFSAVAKPILKTTWNRLKTLESIETHENSTQGREAYLNLLLKDRAIRIKESITLLDNELTRILYHFENLAQLYDTQENQHILDEVLHYRHQTKKILTYFDMTMIKSLIEFELKTGKLHQGKDNEFIKMVVKGAEERLKRFFKQLLDFELVSGIRTQYEFHEHALADLYEYCLLHQERALHFINGRSHVKIEVKLSLHNDTRFFSDFYRIQEAIDTLLQNAFEELAEHKQASQERCVEISLTSSDDTITIDIIDNGRGIPLEHQESIWNRGKSIGKSFGTGIGLAAVKEIVENLHSTIKLQSEEGYTRFTITLPNLKELPNVNRKI